MIDKETIFSFTFRLEDKFYLLILIIFVESIYEDQNIGLDLE